MKALNKYKLITRIISLNIKREVTGIVEEDNYQEIPPINIYDCNGNFLYTKESCLHRPSTRYVLITDNGLYKVYPSEENMWVNIGYGGDIQDKIFRVV